MCFNSDKEQTSTASTSANVPFPERKPTPSGGSSILSSLFDLTNNTVSRIAEIELQKFEAERLADVRAAEARGKISKQNTLAGNGFTGFTTRQNLVGGLSLTSIAMLGAAAILISRR